MFVGEQTGDARNNGQGRIASRTSMPRALMPSATSETYFGESPMPMRRSRAFSSGRPFRPPRRTVRTPVAATASQNSSVLPSMVLRTGSTRAY